ncbi:putative zinc metallo proteinase [Polychaeton citri CBS 116435]|uniref:Zinc metallo proteinase n=1 Tax=Polychaeton citri CBS 116435 TaxID=1314669 RepID=A0A9P4QJI0_9PEZI|nr:putative zinc metallo proteinase [Polychaeton citri CBS 116435]
MNSLSDASHKQIIQPPVLPTLFNASAESILSDTKSLIERGKLTQDAVLACVTPETATFANTVLPLVQEENHRLYERQLIKFYSSVSQDEEVRKASNEAEHLFSSFDTDTAMRNDLYVLVDAVRGKGETISKESCRLLEKLRSEFEQNGLALPEEDRTRLRQINKELDQTKHNYMKAFSESQGIDMWFAREELEGMSDHMLDELEQGNNEKQGKLRLRVEGTMHFNNLMRSVKRSKIRRRIYFEYATSYKANVALLERVVVFREEKARLLGYCDYAELSMAIKMEKSPLKIEMFLEDLLSKISPTRDAFISEWRQMKAEDLKTRNELDDGKFYAWDRFYYSQRLMEHRFDFGSDDVAEFFPLDETIRRMLAVSEQVFGLSFVAIEKETRDGLSQGAGGDALIWHDDVQLFAVWDNIDGSRRCVDFLGYLYMDLYQRPGKRPGFADLPIRPAYTDVNGTRKYTSTGLVCNFSKPSKNKPSLLSHAQVVLLFHELGHGIHDLVAKTEYARFHGASTAGDFNEAPSQMLENWCWLPTTLRMLSQHYSKLSPEYFETWQSEAKSRTIDVANKSQTLTGDMVEKLVRSKKASSVLQCLALLNMSFFDMALNRPGSHHAAATMDTTHLFHSSSQRVYCFDLPEDLPPFQATETNHLQVSGMYIYLTSQLYSLDMFHTVFEPDPMDREQGLRYRRTVIGKGSSEDEMKMMTDFLGRPPNAEALYKELGLIGPMQPKSFTSNRGGNLSKGED